MTLKIDEVGHVVHGSESAECVGLVSEDSMFDVTGDSDVQNAPLAAQNVDVVELGHAVRMQGGMDTVQE
jgi:hypothetical protein